MKAFKKSRTRLLVISQEIKLRDDLVTLLTGYGYFVDYVRTREEGLQKFGQYKQAVVIIDVHALPRSAERLFGMFQTFKKNPIILIAAHREEEDRVYPYLTHGVYDILRLPLQTEYVRVVLRRLVTHGQLLASNEFMRTLLALLGLVSPIWVALAIVLVSVF